MFLGHPAKQADSSPKRQQGVCLTELVWTAASLGAFREGEDYIAGDDPRNSASKLANRSTDQGHHQTPADQGWLSPNRSASWRDGRSTEDSAHSRGIRTEDRTILTTFFGTQPECLDPCSRRRLSTAQQNASLLGTRQLPTRVPPIRPDRNQRAETVNHILLTAQAPLQSVLSRVRSLATAPAGDSVLPTGAREAELRVLLAFVLLGAVVAAATVLLPTGTPTPRKDVVG